MAPWEPLFTMTAYADLQEYRNKYPTKNAQVEAVS